MIDDLVKQSDAFRLVSGPTDEQVDEANWLIDRMSSRIEELEAEIVRLRSHLQWIHDGAHTRGHALPDIKERASIALEEGEDRG